MKINSFSERVPEIYDACKELNRRDKNWRWEALIMANNVLVIRWEYLAAMEEPFPYFTLNLSEGEIFAKDNKEINVTKELEDVSDIRSAMLALQAWAQERY